MKIRDDMVSFRQRGPLPGMRRLLAGVAIVFFLMLVFAAYLRPGFALDMMNRFILCL